MSRVSKKKSNNVSKYIWGLGLEHEMHIFHSPKGKNITDFILFDSESARERLIDDVTSGKIKVLKNKKEYIEKAGQANKLKYNPKDNEIYIEDFEYILSVPYEKTGRKCNGQWVIERVPFDMPEFIIDHPICTIHKDRDAVNMSLELIKNKRTYLNLLMKNKTTQKQVKKYGELCELPFSMTSFLKYPENPNSTTYKFKKDKNKKDKVREEYTGSYHVSITLPYIPGQITLKEFTNLHSNFANMLQWLEPLLLSAFFSCDQNAPGSIKKRVRGSFRVLIIGWGNLAGSDVRKFGEGIGRYCNVPINWRKNLKLHDVEKIKPCTTPSPPALREGARSALSSDFRTIGEIDETEDKQVAKMTIGKGIEFRIFDHFHDIYVEDLVKFIILVAENSRKHTAKKYVYNDKNWIKAVHTIMEDGWCAELDKKYVNDLRKVLNLKIKTKSIIAFDIFKCITEELHSKHKNGLFTKIMQPSITTKLKKKKGITRSYKPFTSENILKLNSLSKKDITKPDIPKINYYSWGMGFMIKCNRNKKNIKSLNSLINNMPLNKDVLFKEYEKILFKCFNKKYWKRDSINIAHFLSDCYSEADGISPLKLTKNINGTIKSVKLVKRLTIKNFNKTIKLWFEDYDKEYVNDL